MKWKFRSRLISTSSPTASRKVPINVSMCGISHCGAIWSVVPTPAKDPPPNVAFCPGRMMFVFRAVSPRALTSLPSAVTSSQELIGGVPRMSWCRTLLEPQWDQ